MEEIVEKGKEKEKNGGSYMEQSIAHEQQVFETCYRERSTEYH